MFMWIQPLVSLASGFCFVRDSTMERGQEHSEYTGNFSEVSYN